MSETSPAPWRWVPAGFATGEIRDAEAGLVAAGVARRDGPLIEAAPKMFKALRELLAVTPSVFAAREEWDARELADLEAALAAAKSVARAILARAEGEEESHVGE